MGVVFFLYFLKSEAPNSEEGLGHGGLETTSR